MDHRVVPDALSLCRFVAGLPGLVDHRRRPGPVHRGVLIQNFGGVGMVVGYLVVTMTITVIALSLSRETRGVGLDRIA